MDDILIEELELVLKGLEADVKRVKSGYGFGNYLGKEETRRRLEFFSECLASVAKRI